jgi:hypothetical protein
MNGSDDLETMRPEDFELPEDGCVFVLEGGGVSLAYIGNPAMESRIQAEAIYRLLTECSGDGKKMSTAVTRGVACLTMSVH